jgi:hypothetical protein
VLVGFLAIAAPSLGSQAAASNYSCGSDLITYVATSNQGFSGSGIRCVRFISGPIYSPISSWVGFSWYGEGRWGSFKYRHIGEAFLAGSDLTARTADIYGNGENATGKLTGGELHITASEEPIPNQLFVHGAWNETWTKASQWSVPFYALDRIKTCGANLFKYRADSRSGLEGFGIRCFLPGSHTWVGSGRWGNARYVHLGYGQYTLQGSQVVLKYGQSDICGLAPAQICNTLSPGSFVLAPINFPHVGDGYLVSGILSERWLPFNRRYAVRVNFARVSDDDGSRPALISPAQASQWVDYMNQVYASAGIQFLFIEDGTDIRSLRSTLINNMAGESDANWAKEVSEGNDHAQLNKLQVYVRYGPPPSPTGGGFSSTDYNFVVMPAFASTSVCGAQNIGILAHETGHYFGLSHPFIGNPVTAQLFKTQSEIQDFFLAHGQDVNVFDGDGLSDTPPDPYIDANSFQCGTINQIVLGRFTFQIVRSDIMSYWYAPPGFAQSLTPMQISRVTQVLVGQRDLDF